MNRKLISVCAAFGLVLAFALSVTPYYSFASRNSGGTYTLPSGNPVVTKTVISSVAFNATTTDIATELTNSLDRNGRGPMLAPLALPSGSVAAPSLTFSGQTTSGLYKAAASDVRLSVAGADAQRWTPTDTYVNGFLDVYTLIQPTAPSADGIFPLGNDMVVRARGSADVRIKNYGYNVTATTSVAGDAGTQTIVIGTPVLCPSSFYGTPPAGGCTTPSGSPTALLCPPTPSLASCSLTVDGDTAGEETIGHGNWSIVDGTHITINPANSHSQPYKIRQLGATFLDGRLIGVNTLDVADRPITIVDRDINVAANLPNSLTGGTWPLQGIQVNASLTGINGSNKNLIYRNNNASSCFQYINAANTAVLFNFCENSNTASLNMGNTTNTTLSFQAAADVGRIKGGGTSSGLNIYASNLGAGTGGTIAFLANGTDDIRGVSIDAAPGNASFDGGIAAQGFHCLDLKRCGTAFAGGGTGIVTTTVVAGCTPLCTASVPYTAGTVWSCSVSGTTLTANNHNGANDAVNYFCF